MNKINLQIILVALLCCASCAGHSQIINTFAGVNTLGFSGDGGPATNAELSGPWGITTDVSGNVFIADADNDRIRKINASGIITTLIGNAGYGFSGDGGPATAAEIAFPVGVAHDNAGNLYIADCSNQRIRKISTSGIISTLAGNGNNAYSGDGGPGTAAALNRPYGVASDAAGNVYIADEQNNRIRMVNTSGIIETVAGNGYIPGGYSGDGGPATAAELYQPAAVAVDKWGNIYIADEANSRIRKVNAAGVITTIAGYNASGYSGDGGPATAAELFIVFNVAVDSLGDVYIADTWGQRIREVNTSGIITTIAGDGYGYPSVTGGYSGDGGLATDAELNGPYGVACDSSGTVYIGDTGNNRVRKLKKTLLTGIDPSKFEREEVTIYPLPSKGSYTIAGVSLGQIIEIYNYSGQKISSTAAENSIVQFDISNHINGIYFVRILNKDGSIFTTKKVVKEQ